MIKPGPNQIIIPSQLDIDDQAVPVLGQHMAQVAELCALLLAFAVEPRLRVGGRLVRLAAAALALEVAGLVAVAALGRALVARTVALVRGPGLEQRAVDREVIGREQAATTRFAHDLLQQDLGDIGFQEPLPVLCERRRMEWLVLGPA